MAESRTDRSVDPVPRAHRSTVMPEVDPIATSVVCNGDDATLEQLCDQLAAGHFEVLPAPGGADALHLCRYSDPTERQAQVLALIARGRSNRDAGAILGISERTVQKHLEHCYRVLEVPGRSAAAEMVWGLLAANGDGVAVEEPARRGLDGRPGAVPGAEGPPGASAVATPEP